MPQEPEYFLLTKQYFNLAAWFYLKCLPCLVWEPLVLCGSILMEQIHPDSLLFYIYLFLQGYLSYTSNEMSYPFLLTNLFSHSKVPCPQIIPLAHSSQIR